MFKIFEYRSHDHFEEILPDDNNIYQVVESYEYSFEYETDLKDIDLIPYFEDDIIQHHNLKINNQKVSTNKPFRIFDCSFGNSELKIGCDTITFNILIKKINKSDFEDMLLYIWKCNSISIGRFTSQSYIKTGANTQKDDYIFSTRFINWVEQCYDRFNELFYSFKRRPHYMLRKISVEDHYEPHKTTHDSIHWILHNLDTLSFDISYSNHPDAIKIDNKYAVPNTIRVERESASYNVYENNIIMGFLDYVLDKLSEYDKALDKHFNKSTRTSKSYSEFIDIKELTLIPYFNLKEKKEMFEAKIKSLRKRYRSIFIDAKPLIGGIRLTPAFIQKRHYNEAYKFIKDKLKSIDFNIINDLPICNIRKLSKLYEYYNLYYIKELLEKNDVEILKVEADEQNIPKMIKGRNKYYNVALFYEPAISDKKSTLFDLVKIAKGRPYAPDFVVELQNKASGDVTYHIFDAKYTSKYRIEGYLKDCAMKYIIGLGIYDTPYQKPTSLSLLYPGNNSCKWIINGYSPQLNYYTSKPNETDELTNFFHEILNS